MPRTRTYRKNVACLEGMWNGKLVRPLTVRPLLQAAADISGFSIAHLTCNTPEEFDHNLRLLRGRRGFGVLYLAFHGSQGLLELPNQTTLELEDIAAKMTRGFNKWVLHLGACSTIAVERPRLEDFVARTGVAMVLGYEKDVDWLESASTELLLLDTLQRYVDMRAMWTAFRKKYASLIELNGLMAYSRSGG